MLTQWLVETANFYHLFHQLGLCLDSQTLSQSTCSTTGWIGQCPIRQLLDLQDSMLDELSRLNLEMHQTGARSITRKCEMLTNHTLRLEVVNRQATVLLRLASLSAT